MSTINEALLDQKLSELEQIRRWSPRLISKLETLIRTTDDYDLFRVDPILWSNDKGISEKESIDLFLFATHQGMFEMEWNIVCPVCAQIVASFSRLESMHPHYVCRLCSYRGTAALDDMIQISFTISPQIRDIAFHHPESLSVEDYYWKYNVAKGVLPFPNGFSFYQMIQYITKLITYLQPGEKIRVEFDSPQGLIFAADYFTGARLGFFSKGELTEAAHQFSLQIRGNNFESADQPLEMKELDFGHNIVFNFSPYAEFNSGKVMIEFENKTNSRSALWMTHYPLTGNEQGSSLRFADFLTGKKLITTQTFRDLFGAEVVNSNEGIDIQDITYLFTDLKDSTALYDKIGDPKAFFLVREHFETLGKVVVQNNGSLVKTNGDAIMAVFITPVDAVRAALDMLHEIENLNQKISQKLILKIGIHTGRSIAVTLNNRLDYFGQTVNIAARVQALAGAGEIYITQAVYKYGGVSEVLQNHSVVAEETKVKGVGEQLKVYKIAAHDVAH